VNRVLTPLGVDARLCRSISAFTHQRRRLIAYLASGVWADTARFAESVNGLLSGKALTEYVFRYSGRAKSRSTRMVFTPREEYEGQEQVRFG
jgi:hypothetical protein